MMTVLKKILAVALLSLTTVTIVAAALPSKKFAHDMKRDLIGFYIPVAPIKVDKFQLLHMSIRSPNDFKEYEQGKNLIPGYAPILFTFEDVTSRKLSGEMGEYYENSPRVLPASYHLKGSAIRFTGKDKQVGEVKFTGTIDINTLVNEQADTTKMTTDKIIVKGDLTIDGKVFKDVGFTWFAGD